MVNSLGSSARSTSICASSSRPTNRALGGRLPTLLSRCSTGGDVGGVAAIVRCGLGCKRSMGATKAYPTPTCVEM
ncbi:hypothetical protein D3C73_1240840 [compost metagenome]